MTKQATSRPWRGIAEALVDADPLTDGVSLSEAAFEEKVRAFEAVLDAKLPAPDVELVEAARDVAESIRR